MTLTPEEIKQIEQEANDKPEKVVYTHVPHILSKPEAYVLGYTKAATKYLLQLKEERQKNAAPFPDKMTFREMCEGLFNTDFLSPEEFTTICDAAEMYANGCLKQERDRAAKLLEALDDAYPLVIAFGNTRPGGLHPQHKELIERIKQILNPK